MLVMCDQDAGTASWPDSEGAVMPFGNVFEKINSEYYQLTSAEKKVADYAVIHQQKTQFMSISELAEEAGVAEALSPASASGWVTRGTARSSLP